MRPRSPGWELAFVGASCVSASCNASHVEPFMPIHVMASGMPVMAFSASVEGSMLYLMRSQTSKNRKTR